MQLSIVSREKPWMAVFLNVNEQPQYVFNVIAIDIAPDLDNRFVLYCQRLPSDNEYAGISPDLSTMNVAITKASCKRIALGPDALTFDSDNMVLRDNYIIALGRCPELLAELQLDEFAAKFRKTQEESYKKELELFNAENRKLAEEHERAYRVKDVDFLTKERPLEVGLMKLRNSFIGEVEMVNSEVWKRMLKVFHDDSDSDSPSDSKE